MRLFGGGCRAVVSVGNVGGLKSSAQDHHGDAPASQAPASSLRRVSMGTEQCVVAILLKLKLSLKSMSMKFFLSQSKTYGQSEHREHW